MCSCGEINKDLKLSDRTWTCNACGTTHDRDILASQNIQKFAIQAYKNRAGIVQINACGEFVIRHS